MGRHLNRYKIWFYVLLFTVHFSLSADSPALAAPHITGLKPEPFHTVGKRLSERMNAKAFAPSLMMANATTGPLKILFLRVDFQPESPDDPTTTGNGTWTDPKYACTSLGPPISKDVACIATPSDYWVIKARDRFISYYNEVSYGALQIQVELLPALPAAPYRLPNTMATYGADTGDTIGKLVQDAVNVAGAGINFSSYDAVLIVHAGAGEETDIAGNTTNDIWSLYYKGFSVHTKEGVDITEAIIMPQIDSQDGGIADPFGVYVHEFGHWLGLPDLYDTSMVPQSDGIGKWGLMGDGLYNAGADGIPGSSPAHHDAWSKTYLGWVATQTISTDNVAVTLAPVETNKQIIKLPASTTTPSQYFLLENRQKTAGTVGYDAGLPGSGMLVWLIDEDVIYSGGLAGNSVNSNPLRPGVKLIEADGNNALMSHGGDYGSPGDPFPGTSGNTSFTPYTNPPSTPYIGSAWLYIKGITVDTTAIPNVNVTIGFAPAPPTGLTLTHNTATDLTWTSNTEADFDHYNVYKNGIFLADTLLQTQYIDPSSNNGDGYTVTAVDKLGYESDMSLKVFFDTISPINTTSPNFINNGSSSTSSNTVTLSISATDNGEVAAYYASENLATPAASAAGWTVVASTKSYSANIPFTLSSVDGTKTVHVWFKDGAGNVSTVASASIVLSSPVTTTGTSGGGGGGCFIATAAYGSYEAPYVMILREFRDRYLLTNAIGKVSTEIYYKVSPPIADFIRGSDVLRAAVRVLLLPLIGFAAFLVKTTLVQKVLFGLLGASGLFVYRKEK